MEGSQTSLLDLLSNDLVLRQTAPYLSVAALLALAGSNKSYRHLLRTNPEAWRHLNLSHVQSAIVDSSPIDVGGVAWRAERMDESLTEDDFYAGPLRGIFSRLNNRHVLAYVQTLILDGLSVPADLVREIVAEDRYNVRILSVRDAKNLNHTKLQQVLRYAVRPTRAEGTPKLKALYVFGHMDKPAVPARSQPPQRPAPEPPIGVLSSEGAQIGAQWNQMSTAKLNSALPADDEERWYRSNGRVLKRQQSDWADTLQACQGIIAFDAVLCRGPRHDSSKIKDPSAYLPPALASIALGKGCEICGGSPEGPARFGESAETALPLLAPPPSHASTVRAAQRPDGTHGKFPPLFLRCEDCLRGRWCERCNRWWCEDCYDEAVSRSEAADANASSSNSGAPVKVYTKLCVEHCLVGEMMMSADGFWG